MGRGAEMNKKTEQQTYYECGICGAYHRWEFNGDCRQDSERFDDIPDNADLRSWDERCEADGMPNESDDDSDERDEETNDHWSLHDAGRDYDGSGESYSERNTGVGRRGLSCLPFLIPSYLETSSWVKGG